MSYAIVTGGSRGLGAGMAQALARRGYDVVVNYVSESSGEKAEAIAMAAREKCGVQALVVRADVSTLEGCHALVDAAKGAFGTDIAVLVNNAGISQTQMFLETPLERIKEIVDTNLMSMLYLSRLVYPIMVDNGEGCVIDIASVGGLTGVEEQAVYTATKAGIIGIVKGFTAEFARYGIRTNAIAPGLTDTDIIKGLGEEAIAYVKQNNPMKDIGSVDDIVGAMEYLLDARFVSGQTIVVDGGASAVG